MVIASILYFLLFFCRKKKDETEEAIKLMNISEFWLMAGGRGIEADKKVEEKELVSYLLYVVSCVRGNWEPEQSRSVSFLVDKVVCLSKL